MAATISPPRTKTALLSQLELLYPAIDFTEGDSFAYSYGDNRVMYPGSRSHFLQFSYSLLHELGHAEALHNNFKNDLELINLERDAWDIAVRIGHKIGIAIDTNHIEKCMDTYRDWLYARSLCPNCHQCGLQSGSREYSCPFCQNRWTVSESRLCKVSRRNALKK